MYRCAPLALYVFAAYPKGARVVYDIDRGELRSESSFALPVFRLFKYEYKTTTSSRVLSVAVRSVALYGVLPTSDRHLLVGPQQWRAFLKSRFLVW